MGMVVGVASRFGCMDIVDVHSCAVCAFLREVIAMPVPRGEVELPIWTVATKTGELMQ